MAAFKRNGWQTSTGIGGNLGPEYSHSQPIWKMVQDAARELTREGDVPFTRRQIIEKVRLHSPRIDSNSINPIIQGLTDNLRGGAPGADGKRVLHSVVRGKFVLYSKRNEVAHTLGQRINDRQPPMVNSKEVRTKRLSIPETENELRDLILALVKAKLSGKEKIELQPEGRLGYTIDGDHTLFHASDILATVNDDRWVSVELKYKSSVTDQFKCRSYDALHMKSHYGDKLCSIMVYAKTTSGISIKQAQRICYPFDHFVGKPVEEILEPPVIGDLAGKISNFLS